MWQFIVSGYLPGTEIQITFSLLIAGFMILLLSIAIFLTWLLQREEKRLTQQVIEAVQAQLQS